MEIERVVEAIGAKRIRITDHADEEAQADKLKYEEVYFSVLNGEIIEDYPKDKPYPSCLIYGQTFAGEPVHSVWAYNKKTKWAVLITVYRPDPERWIDFKIRKKK
ncbi:DUF4258 domain-containing protein [candidate division KSB1 bacterium]|nr:DUF4258 domain-containing protein [candidate division KSB1 bacterium]NIV68518.1 DUF4258 domain-containing protein [Phycisphaerae bacterium]NIR68339.1 DUF4258 domain-containing protein [candidate division KSB1 bacterium]NIS25305.1 DUF4258 domain-containing protein [candidate division KSB1 bacterium]NIT72216.1 DUF4258 domain-containing protein [candidate division KSB1 bacterium]